MEWTAYGNTIQIFLGIKFSKKRKVSYFFPSSNHGYPSELRNFVKQSSKAYPLCICLCKTTQFALKLGKQSKFLSDKLFSQNSLNNLRKTQ